MFRCALAEFLSEKCYLNRFLNLDTYNGARNDLNLGLDPWTSNRYAFAGGNPIGNIELDGHIPIDMSPEEYGKQVSAAAVKAANDEERKWWEWHVSTRGVCRRAGLFGGCSGRRRRGSRP